MIINLHQINNYIRHFFTAKRKGHNVHSPFVYRLCEEVFYNTGSFYDFERFNKVRNSLLNDDTLIKVEDHGAGSKVFTSSSRTISHITKKGVSTQKQSELMYKLINFLKPSAIIELGTSVGLNALYLSGASKSSEVYTIEGSPALSSYARRLAEKMKINNCVFIEGKFDDVFPALLEKTGGAEFIYIDGNHTYEATMRYFKMALNKKSDKSLFVFDDIYWSTGMTEAWNEIKKDPGVSLAIDAFYFGMVFFRKEIKEKTEAKIFV